MVTTHGGLRLFSPDEVVKIPSQHVAYFTTGDHWKHDKIELVTQGGRTESIPVNSVRMHDPNETVVTSFLRHLVHIRDAATFRNVALRKKKADAYAIDENIKEIDEYEKDSKKYPAEYPMYDCPRLLPQDVIDGFDDDAYVCELWKRCLASNKKAAEGGCHDGERAHE